MSAVRPRLSRSFVALAVLVFLGGGRWLFEYWIKATTIPSLELSRSVEVRDVSGQLLNASLIEDGRWRLSLRLDEVDPRYIEALIECEDQRFFEHKGVDLFALFRALGQALWAGEVISGASTLTMQVARLLEASGTRRWAGKLRQLRLALALERQLTKEQILELYLLLAPMGGNLEGVRAASWSWLGRPPRRLTPAQIALLIALPQSPNRRRPDRAPQEALRARDRVLDRLFRAELLSAEALRAAKAESLPTARRSIPAFAPHLSARVRREQPKVQTHYLTIDGGLQARLEALAARALPAADRERSLAIVVADHRAGVLKASVGSRGYQDPGRGFIDMSRAIRSPGSTLKPLIYAQAFGEGLIHPESLIEDRAESFSGYEPENFDRIFSGSLTAGEALRRSRNLPAVLLTEALGATRLLSALRESGAAPKVPGGRPGLAIALGGLGISLEGLVTLYAGLAQGGEQVSLQWRSEQRAASPPGERVRFIPARGATLLAESLAAQTPPVGSPRLPIAWKTGTSYGYRDAWAIGYDGAHVVGVWVGRPDGTPLPGATGATRAAPLLFEAFGLIGEVPTPLPRASGRAHLDLHPPLALRYFRRPGQGLRRGPKLIFPLTGAILELNASGLPTRIRGGRPPFRWLIDGRPSGAATRTRAHVLSGLSPGFVTLTVIDADGQSVRAQVELRLPLGSATPMRSSGEAAGPAEGASEAPESEAQAHPKGAQ